MWFPQQFSIFGVSFLFCCFSARITAFWNFFRIISSENFPDQLVVDLMLQTTANVYAILSKNFFSYLQFLTKKYLLNETHCIGNNDEKMCFLHKDNYLILLWLWCIYEETGCILFSYQHLNCLLTQKVKVQQKVNMCKTSRRGQFVSTNKTEEWTKRSELLKGNSSG